jgi:hypothetical protein
LAGCALFEGFWLSAVAFAVTPSTVLLRFPLGVGSNSLIRFKPRPIHSLAKPRIKDVVTVFGPGFAPARRAYQDFVVAPVRDNTHCHTHCPVLTAKTNDAAVHEVEGRDEIRTSPAPPQR